MTQHLKFEKKSLLGQLVINHFLLEEQKKEWEFLC